jgi:hypothetical protein
MWYFWLAAVAIHAGMFGFFLHAGHWYAVVNAAGACFSAFMLWQRRVRALQVVAEPEEIEPQPETLSSRFASGYRPQGFREE